MSNPTTGFTVGSVDLSNIFLPLIPGYKQTLNTGFTIGANVDLTNIFSKYTNGNYATETHYTSSNYQGLDLNKIFQNINIPPINTYPVNIEVPANYTNYSLTQQIVNGISYAVLILNPTDSSSSFVNLTIDPTYSYTAYINNILVSGGCGGGSTAGEGGAAGGGAGAFASAYEAVAAKYRLEFSVGAGGAGGTGIQSQGLGNPGQNGGFTILNLYYNNNIYRGSIQVSPGYYSDGITSTGFPDGQPCNGFPGFNTGIPYQGYWCQGSRTGVVNTLGREITYLCFGNGGNGGSGCNGFTPYYNTIGNDCSGQDIIVEFGDISNLNYLGNQINIGGGGGGSWQGGWPTGRYPSNAGGNGTLNTQGGGTGGNLNEGGYYGKDAISYGGGGGGAAAGSTANGGKGGDGIAVIWWEINNSQPFSIAPSNSYTSNYANGMYTLTFTSNATISLNINTSNANLLVVGGGGNGADGSEYFGPSGLSAFGGGGGSGGVVNSNTGINLGIASYSVTVGGATQSSSFGTTYTAAGGVNGTAGYTPSGGINPPDGGDNGSGFGNGGNGYTTTTYATNGSNGAQISWLNNSYYGGGGAGGGTYSSGNYATGGSGGGGNSNGNVAIAAGSGIPNTGGGGAGGVAGYLTVQTGGAGGSGVVILQFSYP